MNSKKIKRSNSSKEKQPLKKRKLEIEEEALPRGGKKPKPSVQKIGKEKFEKKKKTKKKREKVEEIEDEELLRGNIPKKIKKFSFKSLYVGMSLLGAVREITELELILSLPNNLKGIVSITEISDILSEKIQEKAANEPVEEEEEEEEESSSPIPDLQDLFYVGQILPCTIINIESQTESEGEIIEGRKSRSKIELSLKGSQVNRGLTFRDISENFTLMGCIQSIEEHGYIVSFGLKEFSGFLLKKNATSFLSLLHNNEETNKEKEEDPLLLKIGQPIFCSTIKKNKNNTLNVTIDPEVVSQSTPKKTSKLSIESIKPGMLFPVTIKEILPNGIRLDFLEFFEGSIDEIHLNKLINEPISNVYSVGQTLNARILYVDENLKHIGFTLKDHLLSLRPFYFGDYKIGEFFEASIIRIYPNLGVFLNNNPVFQQKDDMEIENEENEGNEANEESKDQFLENDNGEANQISNSVYYSGFAPISMLEDKYLTSVPSQFKVGEFVKSRIMNFNYIDGILNLTLKPSHVESSIMTFNDIVPGMLVDATIQTIQKESIFLNITESIKARCYNTHFSDIKIKDPLKKFHAGQKLKCRVLNVDKRKIIVTHKKTLVNTELPIVTSYEGVENGTIVHGYISKVESYGCYVNFYNNVYGLIPKQELGVDIGDEDPSENFEAGQVVKCRIVKFDKKKKHFILSLKLQISKKESLAKEKQQAFESLSCGTFIKGTITGVSKDGFLIVTQEHKFSANLPFSHLTDHPAHIEKLKKLYQINDEIEELLLLSKDLNTFTLKLSLKPSLIQGVKMNLVPSSLGEVKKGSVLYGYIRNIHHYGCFVGFLADFHGLAVKSNLSDLFITDPSDHFILDQSVRAYVLEVHPDTNRLELSLKTSLCFSIDASYLASYFSESERIVKSLSKSKSKLIEQKNWETKYFIGNVLQVEASTIKDFGVIFKLPDQSNLTGFAVSHQIPNTIQMKVGQIYKARILDIDKEKGILDLTLKEDLVNATIQTPSSVLRISKHVDGIVELVKEHYLIISLPQNGHLIGFAPTRDFNQITLDPFSIYKQGKNFKVIIQKIPSSNEEKLLLTLQRSSEQQQKKKKEKSDDSSTFDSKNGNKFLTIQDIKVGMKISYCKIKVLQEAFIIVSLGNHISGRIHITQIRDDIEEGHPFESFQVGDIIENAKVISINEIVVSNKNYLPISHQHHTPDTTRKVIELSIKPSILSLPDGDIGSSIISFENLKKGQLLNGIIHQVTIDALWVHIASNVRGRVFILDASDDINDLIMFQEKFRPGQGIKCLVLNVDSERHALDLSINSAKHIKINSKWSQQKQLEANLQILDKFSQLKEGNIVIGRVSKILPGAGINVQLQAHTYGRVSLTDIFDEYENDPLSQFEELQFMKCYILENDTQNNKIFLSLRKSKTSDEQINIVDKEINSIEDLEVGKKIRGYISKYIEKVGFMVSLNRHLNARISMRNMSDTISVEDLPSEFPVGKLVEGTVLKIDKERNKMEMTLKTKKGATAISQLTLDNINVGDKYQGKIKNITDFGIFVTLKNSKVVGLCHKTEAAETEISDLTKVFKVGDQVKVYVLKKNPQKNQLSLSMKPSRFSNDDFLNETEEKPKENQNKSEENKKAIIPNEKEEEDEEEEEEEVTEMDLENLISPQNNNVQQKIQPIAPAVEWDEFKFDNSIQETSNTEEREGLEVNKPVKKKKKEEEISSIEKELLNPNRLPQNAGDFEKLLLSSPNSSYLWIQYIAYYISLNEYEKARQIGEKALKTISFREEKEKLNVWVALMNLENSYGTQDSLIKVFQEALNFNEEKPVYLSLLDIYQKSQKSELAEELFQTMIKKFGTSKKIWKKYASFLAKQEKLDKLRNLMPKCLQALPKKKHVEITLKFGQLEFKYGDPERGRTIFEGILSTYPKRADVWNVYIDMELKIQDEKMIRRLFERIINSKFSSKKMKHFFKRYLGFEKSFGTEETQQYVKQKAQEYVESITS